MSTMFDETKRYISIISSADFIFTHCNQYVLIIRKQTLLDSNSLFLQQTFYNSI